MNLAVPPFDKSVISPVLVGRAWEIEMLDRALHEVRGGVGCCIVLGGDAGVGKSRLLSEIRHSAQAEPLLTVRGYCFEQDISFPCAPLVDALRTYFAQRSPPEIRETLGPLGPELVKLVPELALLLPDLRPTAALDPEAEKRRLFESLTRFFIRLATAQPLLLILEDLHWSDEISLHFLQLFARRLPAHPILLVATYRQEEAPPLLSHLLAQLNRERLAHEINLAPLTQSDVDAMLRAIFDLPYPVKTEFLDLLYRLTEGNPFLIEEVLRVLIGAGEIFRAGGRWEHRPVEELRVPRSVRDAVQRRIQQLGEVEREVLTLAAVAGRRFGFDLLREATDMNEQELLQIIKQLILAQLVVEESADQFTFRHALTREAVYATLVRRERQALHHRVAETLENLYGVALDPYVADLAYHYSVAEVWTKALQYSRRAGEMAQSLYAPHEAIEHFTRALEAADRLGLAPTTEVLRARGKAYETAGYLEAARGDYEEALRAAQAKHDSTAEWQALIDLGSLWASSSYATAGEYYQRALGLARVLGDQATLGHSLNRLGNWLVNVEQPGEGLPYHEEALDLFQALNDQRGLVETLDLLGMANQLNSDLIQSHVAYRRAIDLWHELGDQWGLASSLASLPLCAANALKPADVPAVRLSEAAGAGEEAIRLAREIGWRAGECYALLNLALCLGPLGEYEQALESAETALHYAEDIEHQQWITGAHTVLGVLYQDMLAFDAARSHLERARSLADAVGSRIWAGCATAYLALTCTHQHEFGRAEALLQAAPVSESSMQTQTERLVWYARAELALARGQAGIALGIADRLIGKAANATAETIIPRLWHLRGVALAALDKPSEAEAALQAAQAAAAEEGMLSLQWRVQSALARLYQAQARPDHAFAALSTAREIIDRCAAQIPDEARDSFTERAMAMLPRLPAPVVDRVKKERGPGLTPRQREIVVLIAQGKANREIADELVVGVRTVEAHITRIFNKLGYSSRAQLAAWAVAQGLVPAARDDTV